jgi:hypothetical protein
MRAKDERVELQRLLEKSPKKIDKNVPEPGETIP